MSPLRAWRNAKKTDALRGEVTRKRNAKGKTPFAKYAEEYLEEWSKREKAFSTYERDTYSVKHLKANFGNREIGGITKRDIEKYVNKRIDEGANPATTNITQNITAHLGRALIVGAPGYDLRRTTIVATHSLNGIIGVVDIMI